MQKKIAVIAGDGVGPEITQQSIKALNVIAEQYGHQFRYSYCLMGSKAVDKTGHPLPADTVDASLNSDAVLLGGVGHPRYDRYHPLSSERALEELHRALGLFTGIRPVKSYPALYHLSPLKSKHIEGVSITVIRGLLAEAGERWQIEIGADGNPTGTGARAMAGATTPGAAAYQGTGGVEQQDAEVRNNTAYIQQVAELAFEYARSEKKKLTLVEVPAEKEALYPWKQVVETVAGRYPDVELNHMSADQAAMQVMLAPAQFGVILADRALGEILSGETAAICGPVDLLPAAAIGQGTALFRPAHGSYPQWAGKDVANPLGSVLSAAMMLDHFQLRAEAELLRQAVNWTLSYNFVTRDIDAINSYSTSIVGDLICEFIENRNASNINPNNISLSHSTII